MNAFQALAKLASDEQWCWNLYCTTCGHTHFRYAFRELARGRHPEEENWVVHSKRTKYPQLGNFPRRYSPREKIQVLEQCKNTDLKFLKTECRFPDWLGYLGLVLHHMQSDSKAYQEVSCTWSAQLATIVPEQTAIHSKLTALSSGDNGFLSLNDLEDCEHAIETSRYVSTR